MSLLVVGTVAFDSIETPFGSRERILGGAATYCALSASYLYNDIRMVSVVGRDFPEAHLQMLRNRGINTDGIQQRKDLDSFFWAGRYHRDLNTRDTLDTQLNVLAEFEPVVPADSLHCDYVMLGNLMPSLQRKVLEQMKSRPKLVAMDTMNFWMDHFWDDLLTTLKMVDVLTVNDEEARQLSGEYSLVKAAKKILTMGPKVLIIKKGEHGAMLFDGQRIFILPALPLEDVFDPTGAGDSFAGGWIGYLAQSDRLEHSEFKRAVVYGSALASFTVEQFGTERLAHIAPGELEARLAQFSELTKFDLPFKA